MGFAALLKHFSKLLYFAIFFHQSLMVFIINGLHKLCYVYVMIVVTGYLLCH